MSINQVIRRKVVNIYVIKVIMSRIQITQSEFSSQIFGNENIKSEFF